MSCLVAAQTGDYSNSATWWTAFNTPGVMASSSNVSVSTSGVFTEAITAPNSTDVLVGVLLMPISQVAGRTYTITLQANTVDVPGANVTISTDILYGGQPFLVKLPSGITTTTGVSYRYKVQVSTGTSSFASYLQGNSTILASIMCKSTGGVPGAGDFFAIHPLNGTTNVTVTVDDTSRAMGDGTAFSVFYSNNPQRTWYQGTVGGSTSNYGELAFKTTVDTKLSWKSNIQFYPGGKLTQKPDSTHRSEFYMNAGSALSCFLGFYPGSIIDVQDSQKNTTYFRTQVASGIGTTGSPLVLVQPANFNVGDRIVITPGTNSSTNSLETEEKYIKTKVDAYTYTLANTAGGAEAGCTYTHVGTDVFHIQRNVKWYGNTADSWHANFNSAHALATEHTIKGLEVSHLNTSGSSARAALCFNGVGTFEDIINFDNTTAGAVINMPNSTVASVVPFKRFLIGNGGSSGSSQDGRILLSSATRKLFEDSWVIASAKVGWKISGGNNTFTRCGSHAGGNSATSLDDLYSGWNLTGTLNVFNDCEAHSDRHYGVLFYQDAADNTFTRWISGTKAKNLVGTVYKSASTPAYNTAYFDTMTQTESTLMAGNTSMVEGSQIVFSNVNNTPYNNYKYTNNGSARITGSGLGDTTTPNVGSYAYRHDPVTSVGIKYRYKQLVTPGAIFVTYGRAWANSAFVSDGSTQIKVDLYMPGVVEGVDTPSATVTMTKTTDKTSENAKYTLTAANTVTRPRYANIVITFTNPSATPSAYGYVGDILNAENDTTKFKVMLDGQPPSIMPLGASTDPGSVSTYVEAQLAAYFAAIPTNPLLDNDSRIDEINDNADTAANR